MTSPNYTPSKQLCIPLWDVSITGCVVCWTYSKISTLLAYSNIRQYLWHRMNKKRFSEACHQIFPLCLPLCGALSENVGPVYFCARYTVTGEYLSIIFTPTRLPSECSVAVIFTRMKRRNALDICTDLNTPWHARTYVCVIHDCKLLLQKLVWGHLRSDVM
jgi:hypothetical protein